MKQFMLSLLLYLLFVVADAATGNTWGWYQYPIIGLFCAICSNGMLDCLEDIKGSPWMRKLRKRLKWKS